MIVFVAGIYLCYLAFDLRGTLKSGRPGLVWPCLILFGAGLVIHALTAFDIAVPSPAPVIAGFISNTFNLK